jgi:hypothetical protein
MDKKFLDYLLNITKLDFEKLINSKITDDDFLLVQIIIDEDIRHNFDTYNNKIEIILDIMKILQNTLLGEIKGITTMIRDMTIDEIIKNNK